MRRGWSPDTLSPVPQEPPQLELHATRPHTWVTPTARAAYPAEGAQKVSKSKTLLQCPDRCLQKLQVTYGPRLARRLESSPAARANPGTGNHEASSLSAQDLGPCKLYPQVPAIGHEMPLLMQPSPEGTPAGHLGLSRSLRVSERRARRQGRPHRLPHPSAEPHRPHRLLALRG